MPFLTFKCDSCDRIFSVLEGKIFSFQIKEMKEANSFTSLFRKRLYLCKDCFEDLKEYLRINFKIVIPEKGE